MAHIESAVTATPIVALTTVPQSLFADLLMTLQNEESPIPKALFLSLQASNVRLRHIDTALSARILTAAVRRNDIIILESIRALGADFSQPLAEEDGTMFHIACRENSAEVIRWLLSRDSSGYTPDCLKVNSAGRTVLAELESNVNLDDESRRGLEAEIATRQEKERNDDMVFAIASGNINGVDEYLNETNIFHLNNRYYLPDSIIAPGDTPLIAACRNGYIGIVARLLPYYQLNIDYFYRRNCRKVNALMAAAQNGHTDIIHMLIEADFLENHAHDNASSHALFLAAKHGHAAATRALLNRGVSSDYRDIYGNTGLMLAAAAGHTETVQAFIDAKSPLDMHNDSEITALIFAAVYGHLDVVQALVTGGANTSYQLANDSNIHTLIYVINPSRYKTRLRHLATAANPSPNNFREIIRVIAAAPTNIDGQDSFGNTALIMAAREGKANIIDILLDAGANPNKANNRDMTALMYMCQAPAGTFDDELIKTMIAGTDCLDHQNHYGQTALTMAATSGHAVIVQALIAAGANPDPERIGRSVLNIDDISDPNIKTMIVKARQPAIIAHHRHMLKYSTVFMLVTGFSWYQINKCLAAEHLTFSNYFDKAHSYPAAVTLWAIATIMLIASVVATIYFMPKACQSPPVIEPAPAKALP